MANEERGGHIPPELMQDELQRELEDAIFNLALYQTNVNRLLALQNQREVSHDNDTR